MATLKTGAGASRPRHPEENRGQDAHSPFQENRGQDAPAPFQENFGQEPNSPFFNPFADIAKTRNYLPHWQQGEVYYFVTWRLGDSLPQSKLNSLEEEKQTWLKFHPQPWTDTTKEEYYNQFVHRWQTWLDAGSGSCILKHPKAQSILRHTLLHFDNTRYEMLAFVVMPNHVHTLFRLYRGEHLEKILHSWKSYSAKQLLKTISSLSPPVWQSDYWDRIVRSEAHLQTYLNYIHDNPEKAHLRPGSYVYYQTGAGASRPRHPEENRGQDANFPFQENRGQDAPAPFQNS